MPSESIEGARMWSMGPHSYAPEWSGSSATEETYGQKRMCNTVRKKAACMEVLENGDIDATLEGKNAWDEAVCNFVPKILDLSIVEWGKRSQRRCKSCGMHWTTSLSMWGIH